MGPKIFTLLIVGVFPIFLFAQQTTYKYEYWYDASGKLFSFRKNDSLLTTYAYDKDGNRATQDKGKMYVSVQDNKLSQNWNSVTIFPNPTTGAVNVNWKGLKGIFSITVYDTWGRVMLTKEKQEIPSNTTHNLINLSRYTTGVYFIQLQNEQTITTQKVLLIAP